MRKAVLEPDRSFALPRLESQSAGIDLTAIRETIARPTVILILLVALSLIPRLKHLEEPFVGEHSFRQTQTALSVWEIREHGFSLLHPKLPLFGPPWECPFEYPVFQLAAAGLDWVAPWSNLDVSIRVTNLLFFYCTAVMLFYLVRQVFQRPILALFAVSVFLFSPFNTQWSRSSMIEYAATFFGLAYLFYFIRWTKEPRLSFFLATISFGVLGSLTKITSFIIPLCIAATLAGLCGLRVIWRRKTPGTGAAPGNPHAEQEELFSGESPRRDHADQKTTNGRNPLSALITRFPCFRIADLGCTCAMPPQDSVAGNLRPVHSVLLGIMLFFPVIAGQAYIKYGDRIKEQQAYTAWLSSNHPYMKAWGFGSMEQRSNPVQRKVVLNRMKATIWPVPFLAVAAGLCLLPFLVRGFERLSAGNFWIGCALVVAPWGAAFVFFNLYRIHSYYPTAGAPFLALAAGASLWLVFSLTRSQLVKVFYIVFLVGYWLQSCLPGLLRDYYRQPTANPNISYLREASRVIGAEEPVIVLSHREWSSFAPYYLKRRVFIASLFGRPADLEPLLDSNYFKKNGFRWLLVEGTGDSKLSELTARITSSWKSAKEIVVDPAQPSYALYSLSDR